MIENKVNSWVKKWGLIKIVEDCSYVLQPPLGIYVIIMRINNWSKGLIKYFWGQKVVVLFFITFSRVFYSSSSQLGRLNNVVCNLLSWYLFILF